MSETELVNEAGQEAEPSLSGKYRQPQLEVYDISDLDEKIRTIKPGDCMKFLSGLKRISKKINQAKIIFHNDADGLFSGILARNLLRKIGFTILPADMRPTSHLELNNIKHEPDYILLDLHLPSVEGLDVLSKIREVDSEVKVYIVTAEPEGPYKRKAELLGVEGYIVKPIDAQALFKLAEKLAGGNDGK